MNHLIMAKENKPIKTKLIKPKEITLKEFLKALSKWKRGYMKKPRSWQKIWFWWEPNKLDPKEQWFMNIARSTRDGMEDSVWVNANNIEHRLSCLEREGYKYHIDE